MIREVKCFQVACDGVDCHEDFESDMGYIPHFQSQGAAEDFVHDSDGKVVGGKVYCCDCAPSAAASSVEAEDTEGEKP